MPQLFLQTLFIIISCFNIGDTYQSNHHRTLLQTQNISCINDTCIVQVFGNPTNIECNDTVPNCHINITKWCNGCSIHCPQTNCNSCIINSDTDSYNLTLSINRYHCKSLSVIVADTPIFHSNKVNTARDGGQLQIIGNNHISSNSRSTILNVIINSFTGFPGFKNVVNGDINCTSNLPNCEINIDVQYSDSIIHCPQKHCISCVINCNWFCTDLVINGYDCEVLRINSVKRFWSNNVSAPGNGGTLQVFAETSTTSNNIFSKPGTANIIINGGDTGWGVSKIYGQHITGYLNFSCIGNALCQYTHIYCGGNGSYCNINCSSSYETGGCIHMYVYAEYGTSVVNWYCDELYRRECFDSQLGCNNISNPSYSEWKWDDLNKWHYLTGDCVEDWIPPFVTCEYTTIDTCSINEEYMEESRIIKCSDDLTVCKIELGSAKNTAKTWPRELHSEIHCPSLECDDCIIQCINDNTCIGMTIYGYNCLILQVNVRGSNVGGTLWHFVNQTATIIYAPGNGGELQLLTDFEDNLNVGIFAHIYSVPGTKNMVIDYSDCSEVCSQGFIDGTYVTDYLNFTCGASDCTFTNIICPNDANCNIDCRFTSHRFNGACIGMNVYAIEGTHDVNWLCNGNEDVCGDATLYCNGNYTQSSQMIYLNNTWKLENKTNGCVDIPTFAPSRSPTVWTMNPSITPSRFPTIFSMNPTEPSAAPTYSPTQTNLIIHSNTFLSQTSFIGIGAVSLFIFMLIIIVLIWYYKYYKPNKQALYIKNGLVIVIGIADYEEDDNKIDTPEINGTLPDLDGIDRDIKHMVHLFHDQLNYDIYPSTYLEAIKNENEIKQNWTEKELKDFLIDRANYLERNIEIYDGLIVIVSGHGIRGNICTSDLKKFSKLAIHRIFSSAHPKSRNIPRLFVFDCCAGNNQQERRRSISDDSQTNTINMDIAKQISLDDVDGDGDFGQPWIKGDHNPDYQLAVIEAANPGFQSKVRSDIGSYVIHSFYTKTMDILINNKRTFIYEIFDKIQDELHRMGKQHPTYIWNDSTRYIRFIRNNVNHNKMDTDDGKEISTEEIQMERVNSGKIFRNVSSEMEYKEVNMEDSENDDEERQQTLSWH